MAAFYMWPSDRNRLIEINDGFSICVSIESSLIECKSEHSTTVSISPHFIKPNIIIQINFDEGVDRLCFIFYYFEK